MIDLEKKILFIFLEDAWDNCVIQDSIMLMHKLNPSVIKSIFTNWTSSFLFSPTPFFLSVLHVLCGLKREKKKKIKTEEESLQHNSDSVIFVLY